MILIKNCIAFALLFFLSQVGVIKAFPSTSVDEFTYQNEGVENNEIPVPNLLVRHTKLLKKVKYMINGDEGNIPPAYNEAKGSVGVLECTGCQAGVMMLQTLIWAGEGDKGITDAIAWFCSNMNIESTRVCDGLSNRFSPEIIYLLRHVKISHVQICSFIMEGTCSDDYTPYHNWDIHIPPFPKPAPYSFPIPKANAPRYKVLHLSDNHYDPEYMEETNANCGDPLCCRVNSGSPKKPEDRAGKWGDYRNCDTPKRTVDNMLEHIAKTHPDIDFIYWTGDLPPHDIWNQTRDKNLNIIKETAKQMADTFRGIPIFPALGNHESSPVNTFPPNYMKAANKSISWLYDELDILWREWLPANVSETVRYGAFYSVLVKPDFRIISLNMNYCNNKNWWILVNSTDPDQELDWLVKELQSAELANEKVHILGHIPPGNNDCFKTWSKNFYRIIGRYESTITAQFYGHTHYDELEIFYDPDDLRRPISVGYIGPSVTPFGNVNPGYRIYYIDGDHKETTRTVVDHESWIMNLTQANIDDNPVWYKLYSAKSAYNMTALRPVDWDNLVNAMDTNSTLFQLYYKHYFKDCPLRPACGTACMKNYLCDIKSARSHDRKRLCANLGVKDRRKIKSSRSKSWFTKGLNTLWESINYVEQEAVILTNEVNPWHIN